MVFGVPFSRRALDAGVQGLLASRREFGSVTAEGAELVHAAPLDEQTRAELQLRRFRRQVERAVRDTDFYRTRWAGLEVAGLTRADLQRLPRTSKADLAGSPGAFVSTTARPQLLVTTSGTTAAACPVWFSRDEVHALTALTAMGYLVTGQVLPEDNVLLALRGAANLALSTTVGACSVIGAAVQAIPPDDPAGLLRALLAVGEVGGRRRRVSVLVSYPSVLAAAVELGLSAGLGPRDTAVRRVLLVGELLSQGLRERARRLLGPVDIVESYGATEITPLGATPCRQEHLHSEPSVGLLEVVPVEGDPCAGTIVATPFAPYRDTCPLLRFDTQDVVAALPAAPTCELAHLPATGRLLGKQAQAIRHDSGWTWPRQVVEALEGIEGVILPTCWSARASDVPGHVDVQVRTRRQDAATYRRVVASLESQGVPLAGLLLAAEPGQVDQPVPVRAGAWPGQRGAASSRGWPCPVPSSS